MVGNSSARTDEPAVIEKILIIYQSKIPSIEDGSVRHLEAKEDALVGRDRDACLAGLDEIRGGNQHGRKRRPVDEVARNLCLDGHIGEGGVDREGDGEVAAVHDHVGPKVRIADARIEVAMTV